MDQKTKTAIIAALGVVLGAAAPSLVTLISNRLYPPPPPPPPPATVAMFRGVVDKDDIDPTGRFAIQGVKVVATNGVAMDTATTTDKGEFTLQLKQGTQIGTEIDLEFSDDGYQPSDTITVIAPDLPYIVYLWPCLLKTNDCLPKTSELTPSGAAPSAQPEFVPVANSQLLSKTFLVRNQGSVHCRVQPCSPDGKWQASVGQASLNASPGMVFTSGGAVCVAGPCPWSKVQDPTAYSPGRNVISVSVLNWSDTVTYKLSGQETAAPRPPKAARLSLRDWFSRAFPFNAGTYVSLYPPWFAR